MRKILLTAAISVAIAAATASTVPFHGKTGRNLRDAVAATCRVERPVADAREWIARSLADAGGWVELPFDGGVRVSVSPRWPDDLTVIGIMPVEWWRFDNYYAGLPGDTLAADLVNMIPALVDNAGRKGVFPPAEIDRVGWSNGVWSTGFLTIDGIETNGWEPPAALKGDVARIVMYFSTVYPSQRLDPWSFLILNETTWPALTDYGIELMMRWSREDPVDEAESARNRKIAAAQGGTGNPFVEWPGLEEYMWGDRKWEIWVDPDAEPDEKLPLRSTYRLTDPRIDL